MLFCSCNPPLVHEPRGDVGDGHGVPPAAGNGHGRSFPHSGRYVMPCAKRLMTVPGIGPIISTATAAAIGKGDVFSKGRDFGAWLGLMPRQMSTGGRTVLGPISKRGNRYLRMLFVQAARAVLLRPQSWEKYGLRSWIEAAARRLNRFKLAIALANKIARVAWGVLHGGRNFEVRSMRTAPQAA